jgi:hypothetical protein
LNFWSGVTAAIQARQFSRATSLKQELEEQQREKTREREAKGKAWKPRFFTDATHAGGRPELTPDGRRVLDGLQKGEYELN